jgi:hypothetical protein
MATEKRYIPTPPDKKTLLDQHKVCYICQNTLQGYEPDEIEYDHIYNYADGYPQVISNFAPVHASKDERKLNCHKSKGQKSPIHYREELRIINKIGEIKGLGDLCPKAIKSVYTISADKKSIIINGACVPLYNQRINNTDHYYFFHEIETRYIENDEHIQLRPLEPKIIPLIFNLKSAVQLLPSLGRLDEQTQTIKIFDGQHKAVAQIIGNNRDYIQSIVFVHPKIEELRLVIYQAHTDFVQQKYKKSHIDSKLAAIYSQKIDAFRERVGDPKAPFTEHEILLGESKARKSQFLLSSIIEETKTISNFISEFVAQDKREQKTKPMLWQSLEKFISLFCNLNPETESSESEKNFRADEIHNISFILEQIKIYAIDNKWEPSNEYAINHKLSRTFFYKTAFNNWGKTLEESYRFAFEQRTGKKMAGPICYRTAFDTDTKQRFSEITKKLFEHPMWVKEFRQEEIAKANKENPIAKVFEDEGLDYIYLTKITT